MDRIRVSEALDAGSIPAGVATLLVTLWRSSLPPSGIK